LHGKVADDLKQMILNDITNHTGLFIELTPPVDSHLFRHGDLDAFYVSSVPDWFKKCVSETKVQDILDAFFTQIMIDSKNRGLWEAIGQNLIESSSRGDISPKRFFDNDASFLGATTRR